MKEKELAILRKTPNEFKSRFKGIKPKTVDFICKFV